MNIISGTDKIRLGIIGATGLVGRKMLEIVIERKVPVSSIRLFASEKSVGSSILVDGDRFIVELLDESSFLDLDVALFSAGGYVSEKYVPVAVNNNCIVIDNGSYWRLKSGVPLIIPEVNSEELYKHSGIISNPNCSTIQLVMVLNALLKLSKINRVILSTYQSMSGGGAKLLNKYRAEMREGMNEEKVFRNNRFDRLFNNIVFHSTFNEDGNTIEEEKIISETRKILGMEDFNISVNCVRIPVENCHCEFINVEFLEKINLNQIKNIISNELGLKLIDGKDIYPAPSLSNGTDEVLVGRIRLDKSRANAYNMWIVADNLRKGAATNAVQILETLIKQ